MAEPDSSWLSECIVILAGFAVAGMFAACSDEFDPKGPLDDQMVVFSILSTDRDVQYVRVQESYMPSGFDPLSYTTDTSIRDAIVSINSSNGEYRTQATLLTLSDTTRYKAPIGAYVLAPFTPLFGRSYEVVVQSVRHGVASASVLVPSQSKITMDPVAPNVLGYPNSYPQDTQIAFLVQLSVDAEGSFCRLFLYYDVLKGKRWYEERAEIPITSSDSSSYSLDFPRYPRLSSNRSTSRVGIIYRNGYYKAIVNRVSFQYRSNKIIFKWATFVVLQADRNLFHYFAATHPDLDPRSIRLDEPMLNPINGALGMVGAYSLDSLVNLLPGNFWGNQ